MANKGHEELSPDSYSFNCVIEAYTRSYQLGNGLRAEAVLERMIEYSKEHPNAEPDSRSFSLIIQHYTGSSLPDAPYRAESMLNWCVDLYTSQECSNLDLGNFAFRALIDIYTSRKLPDAGPRAERLLRQMKTLIKEYSPSKLIINTDIINYVMQAWGNSGAEEAATQIELHLDNLERKYEAGNNALRPNTQSYRLALGGWSRSSEEGKARRALHVLRRMQRQAKNGNQFVQPNAYAYSLVINACSFVNRSTEEEKDAFTIAIKIFDEMLQSDHARPLSLTFIWFFQLCGRLRISDDDRDTQLRKLFKICCEMGLVNDMTLNRLRFAAPPDLFAELLGPVASKKALRFVRQKHLPKEWIRNASAEEKILPRKWSKK
eukprot:CAMPEP_0202444652 /NCGR_PEP_ID=MMETSP1360-20130828/3641_1 /ASSEMBLY_ACC=CAM_ASM_000848 /TAXON_ID=515479 /ORGANISM="Licmophora paradoxa, Strain CCMP2313" /LENGTH=375 /DNA_ID=CAMNT_0049060681 /DNA_START=69 /DNA_END=1196 /DNA_ORIENTATION=-